MKLQVPKDFKGDVHLNGRSFAVDIHGQVEIPDELVSHRFWEQGFTVVAEKSDVKAKPAAAVDVKAVEK